MSDMASLRSEIDSLHFELTQLFRRRLQTAKKIWAIKKEQGLDKTDLSREENLIHQFDQMIVDEVERKAVQSFIKHILSDSRLYLESKSNDKL